MNKSKLISHKLRHCIPVGLCLIVLLNMALAGGSKPNIMVSASAIYPRLSMLGDDEQTYYRTLFGYDQKFNKSVSIDALLEYGSENDVLQNSYRVHRLAAKINLNQYQIKLGRLAIWNALQNARIDGAQFNFRTNSLGTFNFAGGFKADTDFDDDDYSEKTYISASWSKGKLGNNVGFSFWAKDDSKNSYPFAGLQLSKKMYGIRLISLLSVDLSENKISYGKIHVSKKLGSHTVGLGYRQKRFDLWDKYLNVAESIGIAPTVSFDVKSKLFENTLIQNQLSYRLGEDGKAFLSSSVSYNRIYASVLAGLGNENMEYGFLVGTALKVTEKIKFGGSISLNAIDLGNFTDLESSTGAYGWIGWQPKDFIMIKLFGRYANNPYFKQDGRGGVIVNVEL